ncbi:MAG: hypothetical protein DRP42_07435 [Tenericutes bacterium]|nr:MAG: hypothetical protein DRP42_07435 [Mycoplasmatota bacterium]
MAFIVSDTIDGNTASFGFNGWEFNRTFIVGGLIGPGFQMVIEAYAFPLAPKLNDGHPSVPDAYIVAVTHESVPNTSNAIQLNYTYRQLVENYQVSIGSHNVIGNTTKYLADQDAVKPSDNRKPMLLEYTYPDNYAPDPSKAGVTEQQGVDLDVELELPQFTISRTEWETRPADTLSGHPVGIQMTGRIATDRCQKFNSAINAANWVLRPNAFAGVWKLKMNAVSAETTLDWRFTYDFTYQRTWKFWATYQDPQLDQPVPDPDPIQSFEDDLELPKSQHLFPQYRTMDFNLLELI